VGARNVMGSLPAMGLKPPAMAGIIEGELLGIGMDGWGAKLGAGAATGARRTIGSMAGADAVM